MEPEELAEIQEFGHEVLCSIEENVRMYCRIPEHAVPAVVAWIVHTYIVRADGRLIYVTPRLMFVSEEPGSGKSTALKTVKRLVRNGEMVSMPSRAGYMNLVERDQATVCLDEMDKLFPRENSHQEIQNALNTGYEPDGGSITHANRKVDVHAAVAGAGNAPVLRANPGLVPLWTRSITVMMVPAQGAALTEYDPEEHGRMTFALKQSIKSWVELFADELRKITLPGIDGLENRRAQIWRVLRRIGVMAGPEWAQRIDDSCRAIESGRSNEGPVRTPQQRIMADVLSVTSGLGKVATADLVERLRVLPGAPWRFLWPDGHNSSSSRELASLLAPHGLAPRPIRMPVPGTRVTVPERGYDLSAHEGCERCLTRGVTDETEEV